MPMPLDDVHAHVNDLVAHHQRKLAPPAPPPPAPPPPDVEAAEPAVAESAEADAPKRRIIQLSEKTLWTLAISLLAMSAILYVWQSRRPYVPPEVHLPDGLIFESIGEHQGERGWTIDGAVRNGPSNVRRAMFGFAWTDADGRVIAQVVYDLKDLKAGEVREFSALIPGYVPGLTRTMVPLQVQDYNN